MKALDRQRQIYLAGAAGQKPVIPIDYTLLRSAAKEKLSHEAFTYIDGGAGCGLTVARNESTFATKRILPRMLTANQDVNTGTMVIGQQFDYPILTAPIGVLALAHPSADVAVAKACQTVGIPMILSNQASVPMEPCVAALANTPGWFQLYWSKSDALVRSFVRRAERCGCTALVVTLDTTVLGWRTPDLDAAYIPFLHAQGIAQYTSDPIFQKLVAEAPTPARDKSQPLTFTSLRTLYKMARNYPGSTFANIRNRTALKGVRKFTEIYSNPALSWDHIRKLRDWTDLPILLKGILHPEDAQRAVDLGVEGVIVSNHGGRQLDGSVSSFEMLPEIKAYVGSKIDLLIDSGIRTGSDIFKCLALGAKAVCIGRPFAFALAVAGQKGVEAYLKNLTAEFELTMLLSGCGSISDIGPDCLKATTP